MKIAEFRHIVDSLNWSRNDLSASTQQEFARCNVPARLNCHIESVKAASLQVPPRFKDDLEKGVKAIVYAEKTIARWHEAQETEPTLTRGEIRSQVTVRGLYLVHSNAVH